MGSTTVTTIEILDLVNLTHDVAQLNAVYLSICVGVLVILGGVFVYFNFNPIRDKLDKQEEKIDRLREEAKIFVEEARDSIDSTIDSFKIENNRKMVNLLQREAEKQSLELDNKIATLEKAFTEKIESLTKSHTSNVLETKDELSKLASKIKDMRFDIKELMAFKYATEGKMGGIIYSIELLEELIEENGCNDPRVQYRLADLGKRIKDEPLTEVYVKRIETLLTKLEEGEFEGEKELISQVRGNIKHKK